MPDGQARDLAFMGGHKNSLQQWGSSSIFDGGVTLN